ncbi:hypothetical protein D3C83_58950 [compost metagenome]
MQRRSFSLESPAVWGVMTRFGASQSGLSAGSGSISVTSRPAPASRPAWSASASAVSSTMPPRETTIR